MIFQTSLLGHTPSKTYWAGDQLFFPLILVSQFSPVTPMNTPNKHQLEFVLTQYHFVQKKVREHPQVKGTSSGCKGT